MLFDTHAHYNDRRFDEDRDAVLDSMQEHGVGYIVNACAALDEMDCILEIVEKHPFVYATVGVHPHEVGEMVPEDLYRIRRAK